MKQKSRLLFLIMIITGINTSILFAQELLKSGTSVLLETTQQIDSKINAPQSTIDLRVVYDVKVNDKIVIQAGARGTGTVVMAKKAKSAGHCGIIEIKALSVRSVDGQEIQVYSTGLKKEGDNRKGLAWGLTGGTCIFVFPLNFLFLLIKGHEAEFPAGTKIDASILNNNTIKLN